MRRILIVGCGDVALRALPLITDRYRIYALIRNPANAERLRSLGAIPVVGDLDDRKKLTRVAGLADRVLHFSPPQGVVSDARTRNLLSALSLGALPQRMVYISTSGVYGDCGGGRVSETTPVNAQSLRGKLRVNAEQQIREWARRNQVQASILRVPGIYAAERLPLERLRMGLPAIIASEDSYSNHIHADDLARICVAAMERGASCRLYHATDDDEMKMGDYFDSVADAYQLPRATRLSRNEVKSKVTPMMWSFMSESRRLANERMKRELRVKLRYPTIADFLAAMAETTRPE